MMKELGKRVRLARQNKNLSARKLAGIVGITADEIYNIEYARLKNPPKTPTLKTIAEACEVNPEWLITGEGEMEAPKTRNQEIMDFATETVKEPDSSIKKRLIQALASLEPEQWDALDSFIDKMTKGR